MDNRDLCANCDRWREQHYNLSGIFIAAYLTAVNGAEAIVFTGGIGENSAEIRQLICDRLAWAGVELDPESNQKSRGGIEGAISSTKSRIGIYVIPTNEELLIARDTVRLVAATA